MKKTLAIFLAVLLLVSVVACGEKTPGTTNPTEPTTSGQTGQTTSPQDPAPSVPEKPVEQPPEPSQPQKPEEPEPTPPPKPVMPMGDSYWIAYESAGDTRENIPEFSRLLVDLTLWEDGTARIREIEDSMRLVSDGDELNMTWRYAEEESVLTLYTRADSETPYWSGTLTADGLVLNRFGGTVCFRQESIMPEGGMLYAPAELQGVWMIASTEVEGDLTDCSGMFDTLVFEPKQDENGYALTASSENGGGGYISHEDEFSAYQDRELTLLDQSIYSGCGNEEWSVRIGEESPLNKHGLPENIETYVTLLDQNTLLQQRYYSFDQGRIPGVSYQTYKRILPEICSDLEQSDLMGGSYELTGYLDPEGTWLPTPSDIDTFSLHLEPGAYFFRITADDGFDYTGGGGYWEIGRGGALHMTGEADENWLAGAAQDADTLFLWYSGGLLQLSRTESSEWDGYVDTMNDLEGRAFSAPEETLFILYNENYTDMTGIPGLRIYEIDDGPEARYLLVTSTRDDLYFWLNEDGYCREDFGTVNAGESFVIRVNLPESGGYWMEIETATNQYCFELTSALMDMYQNWNYITT